MPLARRRSAARAAARWHINQTSIKQSSATRPHALSHLGEDYFFSHHVSAKHTRVVWWRDPATRRVHHSGAKPRGAYGPGKRYCFMCRQGFSANNFTSQHCETVHPLCRTSVEVLDAILRYG